MSIADNKITPSKHVTYFFIKTDRRRHNTIINARQVNDRSCVFDIFCGVQKIHKLYREMSANSAKTLTHSPVPTWTWQVVALPSCLATYSWAAPSVEPARPRTSWRSRHLVNGIWTILHFVLITVLYISLFTIIMVAQKIKKNYSQKLKTRAIHSKLN